MWMLITVKCNEHFDPECCGNESFPFKALFSCQVFQTGGSISERLVHFLLFWQRSCNLSDSNDTLGTSGWDLILYVCQSTQWPSFHSHILQINVSEKTSGFRDNGKKAPLAHTCCPGVIRTSWLEARKWAQSLIYIIIGASEVLSIGDFSQFVDFLKILLWCSDVGKMVLRL